MMLRIDSVDNLPMEIVDTTNFLEDDCKPNYGPTIKGDLFSFFIVFYTGYWACKRKKVKKKKVCTNRSSSSESHL